MAVEIVMPALEMAQETGTLVRWLKAEGELVRQGEPLMEIETDKVTVTIESPAAGRLANVGAQAGDEIPIGQVIAVLLAEGESAPPPVKPASGTAVSRVSERQPVAATPIARRLAADHDLDLGQIPSAAGRITKEDVVAYLQRHAPPSAGPGAPRLRPASPKARRLAAEHGLALADLVGSGPEGAVQVADVRAALAHRADVLPTAEVPPSPPDEYDIVPIQGKRKLIAERLQASSQTAPHIALTLSIDMTEVLRLMERLRASIAAQTGQTLTITAVLAKLVGATLRRHPRLNAHVVEEEIRRFTSVHLGIAVALDDGLIVAVIRHIERKGLAAIQAELHDLTARARTGGLKPDEVKGSTFTVSNLGMFGIEQFTAILNPPEVGILAVGVIQETPVGVGGQIVLRPMMQLTLNADHRAVDGAVAAAFLKELKEAMENPYLLLI